MTRHALASSLLLAASLCTLGCADDGAQASTSTESSTGDGDGDATGDGDGEGDTDSASDTDPATDTDPSGDGDGDTSASGDGDGDGNTDTDPSGDGDGDTDTAGDGDGDTDTDASGDGDGDPTTSGDGDGDPDTDTGGDGDGDGGTDTDTGTGDGDGDGEEPPPVNFDNCGFPEDGPWIEIEYWQLGSVSSPSWEYSDTPGWGEDQWAWGNEPWPEIFEFGGNQMNNDPIGIVAEISGTWQLMMGLQDLQAYDHATVCIEGRSVSVGSSAIMEVSNPSNNCGVPDVEISHSWEVHAVGVDLGNCLTPGQATQAVRIDPWGGSGRVGLKRVRVTLHGAVY